MEIAVGKLTRDNFTEFSTKARIEKKSLEENSCKFLETPSNFQEKYLGNENSVGKNMACRHQDFKTSAKRKLYHQNI